MTTLLLDSWYAAIVNVAICGVSLKTCQPLSAQSPADGSSDPDVLTFYLATGDMIETGGLCSPCKQAP